MQNLLEYFKSLEQTPVEDKSILEYLNRSSKKPIDYRTTDIRLGMTFDEVEKVLKSVTGVSELVIVKDTVEFTTGQYDKYKSLGVRVYQHEDMTFLIYRISSSNDFKLGFSGVYNKEDMILTSVSHHSPGRVIMNTKKSLEDLNKYLKTL